MDKILSARVDEAIVQQIGVLASQLKITKKAVIESAIKLFSEHNGLNTENRIFEQTCGAWSREESIEETVNVSREAFNRSMKRYAQ